MGLITTANLKTRLGITGTAHDLVLAEIIASAEEFVAKRLLGRSVITKSATAIVETKSGNGGVRLYTKEYPIPSSGVDSLTINGETIPARPSVLDVGWVVESADFGVITLAGYEFYQGIQNVVVTYLPGWDSGSEPQLLKEAAYMVAVALWNMRDKAGLRTQTVEGLAQELTPIEIEALSSLVAPYVRKTI